MRVRSSRCSSTTASISVSLAAVTSRALRLASGGEAAAGTGSRRWRSAACSSAAVPLTARRPCYRRASESPCVETRAEALYRLGLRCRRDGRFEEAAGWWRALVAPTDAVRRRGQALDSLRQFAIEALAIHQEHRARDLHAARELALFALEETAGSRRADGMRHRLARLDRKLVQKDKTPSSSWRAERFRQGRSVRLCAGSKPGRNFDCGPTWRRPASWRPSGRPCGSRRSARRTAW